MILSKLSRLHQLSRLLRCTWRIHAFHFYPESSVVATKHRRILGLSTSRFMFRTLLVSRLWFRRAADGECTRDCRVPGRKCAAQANIEEKRKRVRLLKVLAPVPRHIHLARPPRTCVCRLLCMFVCVFVRIDAYIELVHMRTPAYPICSYANDRRRVSLSRDPETPGFHNLDLDDLTSRRRRLVLLLGCCEASIRTRSAVKAKIDTNASLYF